MDLRFTGDEPTDDERAAVDELLGEPADVWRGGARGTSTTELRVGTGGRSTRHQRHLLLPALHALRDRVGWISRGGLDYVCRRLTVAPAEAWGVASFYDLFSFSARPPRSLLVCDDLACALAGSRDLVDAATEALGPADAGDSDERGAPAWWRRSQCLGLCDRAPAVLVHLAGPAPAHEVRAPARQTDVLEAAAGPAADPAGGHPGWDVAATVVQRGDPSLVLLSRVGVVDPTSLDDYRGHGGYRALERALELGPDGVRDEVRASRLLGRGGAAFPAARKWDSVAAHAGVERHLVCNADESEPGTFNDRVLLEGDPYAIVEACTIAAFACGIEQGYVYLRGEYPVAEARLAHAIAAARDAGLLGSDVAGSGVRFDLEIRRGAGAYICGEETAIFNSIEGHRGEPRSKPPFPTDVGLFGRPTLVNNVETLANVLPILTRGGAAFAEVGTAESTGTKLFCVSGAVSRPGVVEVPFGATVREVLDLAGGVRDGAGLRAVLLGGAAGSFLPADRLDLPLTFEGSRAAGATLGSGVVMAIDRSVPLLDLLRRIAAFFRHESCGQCVPCRVGTVRQLEALDRLAATGHGSDADREVALLTEVGRAMRDASICGLGQTAWNAIESAFDLLDPLEVRPS